MTRKGIFEKSWNGTVSFDDLNPHREWPKDPDAVDAGVKHDTYTYKRSAAASIPLYYPHTTYQKHLTGSCDPLDVGFETMKLLVKIEEEPNRFRE